MSNVIKGLYQDKKTNDVIYIREATFIDGLVDLVAHSSLEVGLRMEKDIEKGLVEKNWHHITLGVK